MVVVIIYGISEVKDLKNFMESLVETVAYSVEELELKITDVSLFFPNCPMASHPGKEIIIFVDGLTHKPKRTEAAKNRLAQSIILTVSHFVPRIKNIECFIKTFKPKHGFSSLVKQ